MDQLPPIMRDQRKVDLDHLRLLSIFHFILAGLAILGLGFLFLHYTVMSTVMNNPEIWKDQKGGPPPKELFAMFKWFYICFGAFLITGGIGNLLAGWFLHKRKNRIFSLIVGFFNCIQFPFGTVLGIFTLVVLLRDSVREIYEARP